MEAEPVCPVNFPAQEKDDTGAVCKKTCSGVANGNPCFWNILDPSMFTFYNFLYYFHLTRHMKSEVSRGKVCHLEVFDVEKRNSRLVGRLNPNGGTCFGCI